MAGSTYLTTTTGELLVASDGAFIVWAPGEGAAPPPRPIRPRARRAPPRLEIGQTAYCSAAELVRRVLDFAQRTPEWAECVLYDTRRDERWHLPLVSWRVYGTWDESLVIMAAAGLDSVEQELTERRLVLPTQRQLAAMKTRAGFVNDPFSRTPEQTAEPLLYR